MPYVIGVDVGSQSTKGVLLDPDGRCVQTAGRPLRMSYPQAGWAEQAPAEWEASLAEVVRELVAGAGIGPREVAALAMACQVDGVVAVDAGMRALRPAIIWLDRRAERQAARLEARLGRDAIFGTTGLVPDASHSGPKMMWLRDHEPEMFAQAAALAPVAAYLVGRLTGTLVQDPANASSTLLFDIVSGTWSTRLCEAADLNPDLLPPVRPAAAVAGYLTPRSAEALGLTTAAAVCVGTGDDHGAALATGAIGPGVIADVTGTAEPVAVAVRKPVFDPGHLVETHAHAVDGVYLVENPGFVSGGSTLWLSEQVLKRPQSEVFDAAAAAPPGSGGVLFLPALSGAMAPRWNSGMRGAFAGLAMTTGAGELSRAVLEGCAFALRDIVERFDELGLGEGEVRIAGGGGRSALWCQIKADVLGRPVRQTRTAQATALGAAMLAGVAAGTFADLDDAADRAVRLEPEPIAPNLANLHLYQDAYMRYRALFDHVEEALA